MTTLESPPTQSTPLTPVLTRVAANRRVWLLRALAVAVAWILGKALLPGTAFPGEWHVPLGAAIAAGTDWFVDSAGWLHGPLGTAVEVAFGDTLYWMHIIPPPVFAVGTVAVVFLIAGPRLAALTALTTVWVISTGMWNPALETLALMIISVLAACAAGIVWGTTAALSRRVEAVTTLVLDAMQTIPAHVYLVPVVLIFGTGDTGALIVTMIYAIPPTVRLTMVGLHGVSRQTTEAAVANGATAWQVLTGVQLPLARSSIMAGVNQTIMCAMSMTVITAMIGSGGLGQPVWRSVNRLEFGQAMEAGIALVLMAIILDRTSGHLGQARPKSGAKKSRRAAAAGIATLVMAAAAAFSPSLWQADFSKPPSWMRVSLRGSVDLLVDWINTSWGFLLKPISDGVVHYGLSPAAAILNGIPWPVALLLTFAAAWYLIGRRAAILAAAGIAVIGFLGQWEAAVITASLTGTAVLIAVLIGIPVGVAMSFSNKAAALIRPALDVLQTMPIYLFVIPAVIIIGSGPVGGVIATVLYAVAPVIRMTNLALRNSSPAAVEAARSFGATPMQLLRGVRFPLGLPTILTGINQTIMLALAMAVVSAFIGSSGLGASILTAVTRADMATGFEAGASMLILAVVVDRLMVGAVRRLRQAEGVRP